jgi:hypothetical protein
MSFRESFLDDGMILLARTGVSPFDLNIHFVAEHCASVGPMHEFRTDRALRRSDRDGDFEFHSIGLSARPNAFFDCTSATAAFCTKAVVNGHHLPVRFQFCIFEIGPQYSITLADVDQTFARAITEPGSLASLPFVPQDCHRWKCSLQPFLILVTLFRVVIGAVERMCKFSDDRRSIRTTPAIPELPPCTKKVRQR